MLNVECRMPNVECQATEGEIEVKVNSKVNSKMNSERIEPSSNCLGRSAGPFCYESSRGFANISYDDLR
jgi:hypothetical protein